MSLQDAYSPYSSNLSSLAEATAPACGSCQGNDYMNRDQYPSHMMSQQPMMMTPQQPRNYGNKYGGYNEQVPSYGAILQRELMAPIQPNVNQRRLFLTQAQIKINYGILKNLKKNILYVSKELGIGPNWLDMSPDGGAVWKYSQMIKGKSIWNRVFNKVEVSAERKAHNLPMPHVSSITTTTKVKLDCDLVKDLQKDLPQISYCPESHYLRITMDSLPHNLAILALVCGCQQNKFTPNKLRYYNLPKKYLALTTPGNKKYNRNAKYSLIKIIKN